LSRRDPGQRCKQRHAPVGEEGWKRSGIRLGERDQVGPDARRKPGRAGALDELAQVIEELGLAAGDVDKLGADHLGQLDGAKHSLARHDLRPVRRARVMTVRAPGVAAQAHVEHQRLYALGVRCRRVDRE